MKRSTRIALAVGLALAPSFALAQAAPAPVLNTTPAAGTSAAFTLPGQGIFGCNQTGAYAMSVGSLAAVGGTFVPVSDNAVTLNTGYLVYLECTLRPVVDAQAHAITYTYSQAELQQFLTGNNGNPYFPQYFNQDQQNVQTQAVNAALPTIVSNVNPAFQSDVQTALARNYSLTTNAPYMSVSCPYAGSANDLWGSMAAIVANPACTSYGAYTLGQNQVAGTAAAAQYAWVTQLNWGRGIYPVTDSTGKVITPGSLVGQVAGQALLSGQQMAQNANDVGQIVNSFVAGLANQILNVAGGGLAGLNTSINGQPSYLAQANAATQQELSTAINNTALAILGPVYQVEQQYNSLENQIAASLKQTIDQLRADENACWALVVQNVCTGSTTTSVSGGKTTCTDSSGTQLHVATSTEFSQPVIDSQIAPLANTVAQNITNSQQNLQIIQTLIAQVQSASSPDAQTAAINQVDQLVAQNAFDTQTQVNNASQDLANTQSTMQTLLTNTTNSWTGLGSDGVAYEIPWNGSVSSPTGWCNVNQKQTITLWQGAWSQ